MRAGPRIALVAGELSGDLLGAALIEALRRLHPQARFYGVAGPHMVAAGCVPLESIEALSIMGIAEVLPALPRLLRLRAALVQRFVEDCPDLVVGIDAPDFNLGLERRLRVRGLRTAHLVSPTVWAWRQGRVKAVRKAVDLMLCLFPFEPAFYARHGVQARYIGHPLADTLDAATPATAARAALGMDPDGPVLAVLPGSRHAEVHHLAERFAAAAQLLAQRLPGLRVMTPVAKPGLRPAIEAAIARAAPGLDWTLLDGCTRTVVQACDAVLVASGTATLECLLLGRPMTVAYRGSALTAWLLLKAGLLKSRYVSLPNLLAEAPVVGEFLQDAATAEALAEDLWPLMVDGPRRRAQLDQFDRVRDTLHCGAADAAARALDTLL